MAYEVVMPYHLHMPSYFLETFTEYPYFVEGSSSSFEKAYNEYLSNIFSIASCDTGLVK